MTITPTDILLYSSALFILFLTPGPVWVALVARAISGGFHAAWPLALGVVIGDAMWPLLAVLGVSWVVSVFAGFMTVLRILASLIFVTMGVMLMRRAGQPITENSRLTRPGIWAGFLAGLAVIMGNPKAILFYMGVLPGFFDLTKLTWPDIGIIMALSMIVPLVGNLILALFVERIRRFLKSPNALKRTNLIAGGLLIAVGLIIPIA